MRVEGSGGFRLWRFRIRVSGADSGRLCKVCRL